jgi:hypothetical protein
MFFFVPSNRALVEVDIFQSDQMIRKKSCRFFQRIAQKVAKSKKGQNIYNKAQFENSKRLHQTTLDVSQTNMYLA